MKRHFVGFWNLENLFAPEGHPERIDWVERAMRSDLRGWTQDLYDQKLTQLARVISAMNADTGPDILGVCEVEDRFVLQDLVAKLGTRTNRNYGIIHADNQRDKRGIDTAFLFDQDMYTVPEDTVFSHFVVRRTGTRDILQATFVTQADNHLVVLANHWPSRSGGKENSAGFRATAGETLSYWHGRIREEAKDADRSCILALGDFNDDPFDPSLRYNANSTRERGDVERSTSAKFYNLAWEYLQWETENIKGRRRVMNGTLYFSGDGNVFDQILANRAVLDSKTAAFKVIQGSAKVDAIPEMVSHRTSEGPIRFGLPKGNVAKNINTDGFSDHFPVSVQLQER